MCDGDDVDEHSGYITSPNFPENYHNNEYCFTNLSPPPGKVNIIFYSKLDSSSLAFKKKFPWSNDNLF